MKATCPLCGARRTRRACPGVRGDICAVCCGTKRLTEIACPPDCAYLSSARAHPPAIVQRQQERDFEFLLPRIRDLSEAQYRLMLVFQALIVREAAGAMPPLIDADVADACASTAATLETARRGIIYEHHAASIPAQRLAAELKLGLAELTAEAGAHAARVERDTALALRVVERTARDAAAAFPDAPDPNGAWLAFVRRLMKTASAEAAEDRASAPPSPDTPRILIP
jgi:hypothetical protein